MRAYAVDGDFPDDLVVSALRRSGLSAFGEEANLHILDPGRSVFGGERAFLPVFNCHKGTTLEPMGVDKKCAIWLSVPINERQRLDIGIRTSILTFGITLVTKQNNEQSNIEVPKASNTSTTYLFVLFRQLPNLSDGKSAFWQDSASLTAEVWRSQYHPTNLPEFIGDSLPVLKTTPLLLAVPTGIVTTAVQADEEATAAWFMSVVRREEELARIADPNERVIQLGDDIESRVERLLADLLRYRLAGPSGATAVSDMLIGESDSALPIPIPAEVASSLRWFAWIHGSSWSGTLVLFSTYVLVTIGLVISVHQWLTWRSISTAREYPYYRNYFHAMSGLEAFITYALPALGFLGTIEGLGSAFGTVGIISKIETQQKLALMKILLDLGTAFSTTFIALIGGLVITACFVITKCVAKFGNT
jgi:hypothetical protein